MEALNDIANDLRVLSVANENHHQRLLETLQSIDAPVSRMIDSLVRIDGSLEKSKRLTILNWMATQPYANHHRQGVFKCAA